jgi:hypothetical protein
MNAGTFLVKKPDSQCPPEWKFDVGHFSLRVPVDICQTQRSGPAEATSSFLLRKTQDRYNFLYGLIVTVTTFDLTSVLLMSSLRSIWIVYRPGLLKSYRSVTSRLSCITSPGFRN